MPNHSKIFTPAIEDRAALTELRARYPHLSHTQIIRLALVNLLALDAPVAPLPRVRRGRKPRPDSKKSRRRAHLPPEGKGGAQ